MSNEEIDSILANFMNDIEVFGSEVVGTPTESDMRKLDNIYEEYRNEIKSHTQQIALEATERWKSICGCPMCEHHSIAYATLKSQQPQEKGQE